MTIPAGMKKASFDIAIDSDIVVEGDENFTLVINSSSPPVGSSSNEAVVTIVDDDCK